MNEKKIFSEKLVLAFEKLKQTDVFCRARLLGLQKDRENLVFDFFNRRIAYTPAGFKDFDRHKTTDAVLTVLINYLLLCPDTAVNVSNKLVSFREFKGAGPLTMRFTENTGKIIETTFSGRLDALRKRCIALGGIQIETKGYDLSVRFKALHRVPVILQFNDIEDLMPGGAVFLFYENADKWLDIQSLMVITTYLTGQLIQ